MATAIISLKSKVRLSGMKTEELNGATGTVQSGPDTETGRWTVQLEPPVGTWASIAVLPSKLEILTSDPAVPGKPTDTLPPRRPSQEQQPTQAINFLNAKVRLGGMKTEHLNGATGTVTDGPDDLSGRWTVQLEPPIGDCSTVAVLPSKLEILTPNPAGEQARRFSHQQSGQVPLTAPSTPPAQHYPPSPYARTSLPDQPQPFTMGLPPTHSYPAPPQQYNVPNMPANGTKAFGDQPWQKHVITAAGLIGKLVSGVGATAQRPPMMPVHSYPCAARPPNPYMGRPQGMYPPQGYPGRPQGGYPPHCNHMGRPQGGYPPQGNYNGRPQGNNWHGSHMSAGGGGGGNAPAPPPGYPTSTAPNNPWDPSTNMMGQQADPGAFDPSAMYNGNAGYDPSNMSAGYGGMDFTGGNNMSMDAMGDPNGDAAAMFAAFGGGAPVDLSTMSAPAMMNGVDFSSMGGNNGFDFSNLGDMMSNAFADGSWLNALQ